MSTDFKFDVFLSHSSRDKVRVSRLAERLRDAGLRVWFDESDVKAGENIYLAVVKGLRLSRVQVLCLSNAAIGAEWVDFEFSIVMFRDPSNQDRHFIPLLLETCEIPDAVRPYKYIDYRTESHKAFEQLISEASPSLMGRAGRLCRSAFLKTEVRQPEEVFAIELLKHPPLLNRAGGKIVVRINRDGAKHVLISNRSKEKEVERQVTKRNRKRLKKRDLEIQDVLTGTKKELDNPNSNWPKHLRWASGGVLSIVSFTNEGDKEWVPLFFRDIRPYGWNISLGSTQRAFCPIKRMANSKLTVQEVDKRHPIDQEWLFPANYIVREFLEESLVVVGKPTRGKTLPIKRFEWPEVPGPEHLAARFSAEHLKIRKRDDGLSFRKRKKPIELKSVNTRCALVVHSEGSDGPQINNVLVSFSLLDLGIEVVKIVRYELEPGEWLLDGEILDKQTKDGQVYQEMVRMPVAFLSLDYLKKTFGSSAEWQNYTAGDQPSIEVVAPKEVDIKFPFDWDIRQRLKIINSSPEDEQRKNEKKRHVLWYDKFHSNFLDLKGKRSFASTSGLFVPSTAKILNLCFNLMEKPRLAAKRKVNREQK